MFNFNLAIIATSIKFFEFSIRQYTSIIKVNIDNSILFHLEIELDSIPTKGVVPECFAVEGLRLPEVAWTPIMVQNNLLIEIGQIRHQRNTLPTSCKAADNSSISSLVL